jgi:hypothetical protein
MAAIRVSLLQLRNPESLAEKPVYEVVLPDNGRTVVHVIPGWVIRALDPNCRPLIQVERIPE